MPEEMFPRWRTATSQMRLKRFNINPFAIGGRYAGIDHADLRPRRDQRVRRRRPAAQRGRAATSADCWPRTSRGRRRCMAAGLSR